MTRYVMRRLLLAIPVLLGIMTAVFIMIQLIPGDPATAMAGDKGSVEQVARIREELGLNRSLPVQYAYFLKAAFTLNFGDSIRTNQPVAGELRQFFGATIELSAAALVIALAIGIPAGVIAATHRSTPLDYGTMLVALIGISTPVFWAGIVLIYILSFRLGLFPIGGIIGTGKRAGGPTGRHPARVEERLDPDRDRDRSPVRLAHLRGVSHGNGLRSSRSGQIRRRRDRRPGLPGDPGHGSSGRGGVRSDQLAGRRGLCRN